MTHSTGSTITGFAGGAEGKRIAIAVRGSGDLTFAHISAASSSFNSLSLPGGTDLLIPDTALPKAFVFYYDSSAAWWELGTA